MGLRFGGFLRLRQLAGFGSFGSGLWISIRKGCLGFRGCGFPLEFWDLVAVFCGRLCQSHRHLSRFSGILVVYAAICHDSGIVDAGRCVSENNLNFCYVGNFEIILYHYVHGPSIVMLESFWFHF